MGEASFARGAPPVLGMSCPVLMYLDPAGCQRCFSLLDRGVVTLGRRPEADVCLPWDPGISRLHAELIHRAGEWLIADDGLSQNGTLVNGMPVEGRRRLRDGDLITLGRTTMTFCEPSTEADASGRQDADVTMSLPEMRPVRTYSEQQQLILRQLCRPLREDGEGVQPAADAEIARVLALENEVIVRELDAVAYSFGYADIAIEERRLRTALTALRSGLVDTTD
jgi:pSer/pThr/pTyr-binding forkhead associated (FHA) protein